MTVPEAAVHKHYAPMSRDHHVRFAGQVRSMKPVAEATRVKPAPEDHFGLGILASDPAHDEPALFRRQYVGDFVSLGVGTHAIRLQRRSPLSAIQVQRQRVPWQSPEPVGLRFGKAAVSDAWCDWAGLPS